MAGDNRVTIRYDDDSWAALQQMAKELNMNFNHFASVSLSMGAKALHRQMTAFERIPDTVWQHMAMGFGQAIDETRLLAALSEMVESNPEKAKRIFAFMEDAEQELSE